MPDGAHFIDHTERSLVYRRSDGAGEIVTLSVDGTPCSVSPDGILAFAKGADLWLVPLNLRDPDHPAFVGALKWATEHGYGRPLQRLEADGKVNLTIRLVRELGEGPVRTVVSDRALGPGGIRGPA